MQFRLGVPFVERSLFPSPIVSVPLHLRPRYELAALEAPRTKTRAADAAGAPSALRPARPSPMTTATWLKGHGIELVETPDALLGQGERGGFVRLARRRGEFVAVKVFDKSTSALVASLPLAPTHQHLVQVMGRLSGSGHCAEIRALCSGGELYDRIAEEGALPISEALVLFNEMVSAAAHSHACGVAHGQLRPEHVLLNQGNAIQMLGFSNACGGGGGVASTTTHASGIPTGGNSATGTGTGAQAEPIVVLRPVRPMDAPEWHADGGLSSCLGSQLPAADVWSMCILLLVMLSGGQPFASSNPAICPKYAKFLQSGDLAGLLGSAFAVLPEWLRPLIHRALSRSPENRPTTYDLAAAIAPAASWRTPPLPSLSPMNMGSQPIAAPAAAAVSASTNTASLNTSSTTATAAIVTASGSAIVPSAFAAAARAVPCPSSSDDDNSTREWWAAGWCAGWKAATSLLSAPPAPPRAPPPPRGAFPTTAQGGSSGSGGAPFPDVPPSKDSDQMPPPRGTPRPSARLQAATAVPVATTQRAEFDALMSDRGSAVPASAAAAGGAGGAVHSSAPLRPSAQEGYVRSLGWQALPHPSDVLISAISASLVSLDAPFTLREQEYRFVVRPTQNAAELPPTPQSDSPALPEMSPSRKEGAAGHEESIDEMSEDAFPSGPVLIQPLVIFIQLFRARPTNAHTRPHAHFVTSTSSPSVFDLAGENPASPRHDVSVRRVMGTSWRFQSFYVAFRTQMSRQLGMTDYSQLSLFSPMPQRRLLTPQQQQPSVFWTASAPGARGARSKRESELSLPGSRNSPPGAAEDERSPHFKRTKAKLSGTSTLLTRTC